MKVIVARELNAYPELDQFESPKPIANECIISVEYAAIKQLDKAIVKRCM
ncbi:hypothetical protein [Acinetobacter higginsii]